MSTLTPIFLSLSLTLALSFSLFINYKYRVFGGGVCISRLTE
jgi:hypothetical protein